MILNSLLHVVTMITNQEHVCMIVFAKINVKFRGMIYNYMLSVHVVYFWRDNSPAFELLQLTVVQHTSHVLIHLLQIHIEKKGFLLGIQKPLNFLHVICVV